MERLVNCEHILDIALIENISGGNQKFDIFFVDKNSKRYKLSFPRVWDMRYSIENGYLERFCRFRENLPDGIIDNGIYIVEDSNYMKYFEKQVLGSLPTEDIVDYLLYDEIDTTIEILALAPPEIIEV